LEDSLGRLVRRLGGGSDPATVASVFHRWEEIAGRELAEHVRPVRLTGATLVVAADHAAWATRARSESAAILARVGEMGSSGPTRLDVVVRHR
jgi:predicted nucleic acid-binding Zn ribbon protein